MAETKSTALMAIGGTLAERKEAFHQMGASMAMLQINGWDTAPKCIAAAWLSDGLGVHPAVFMENTWPIDIGGKKMIEHKWEFVLALLRTRVPGFDYEMIERSETAAEIKMLATGRLPKQLRYTMDDARRQGLADKDTYKKNPKELLWKQCFKKCADLIAPEALMGLPSLGFDEAEPTAELPAHEPSGAVVVEDAPAAAKPAPAPKQKSAKELGAELKAQIVRVYGPDYETSRPKLNEKLLEVVQAITENGKQIYRSPAQVTTMEWPRIIEHLAKQPDFGKAGGDTEAAATEGAPVKGFDEMHAEQHEQRDPSEVAPEIPAMDEPEADSPPPADFEGPRSDGLSWEEFNVLIAKERRRLGASRPVVKEAPAGSGRWYLTDGPVVKELGYDSALCLMRDGAVVVSPGELSRIARVITEHGDKAEAAKGRK